ncbi:hypothetical protein DFS34DRAFT_625665 [Phlyctochytrium arcticum]|nr:hypothetical protein DFS34DRAFT_625665 [Phlyctochytrium arcticum]
MDSGEKLERSQGALESTGVAGGQSSPSSPTLLDDVIAHVQQLFSTDSPIPLLRPPEVKTWSVETILLGTKLAGRGTLAALRSQRTRSRLVKAFIYLAAVAAALFTLTHIIFLPLRLIHWGSNAFVRPILGTTFTSMLDWTMDRVDYLISWFLLVTPDAGLYLIRYAWPEPLDRLFFEALRSLALQSALPTNKSRFILKFSRSLDDAPNVSAPQSTKSSSSSSAGRLESTATPSITSPSLFIPPPPPVPAPVPPGIPGSSGTKEVDSKADTAEGTHEQSRLSGILFPGGRKAWSVRMLAYVKRYVKRLLLLAGLYLISLTPIIGGLTWPLATFSYLGMSIGYQRAVYFYAAGLVSPPWWRFVRGPLLRGIWSFRALERELVEPYLCRSEMNVFERRAWFRDNEPIIAGFTIPFYLLLSIPWVGPLSFGIAQAATASLCIEIFAERDLRSSKENVLRLASKASPKKVM